MDITARPPQVVRRGPFPGGAPFAFTILDDTDDATEANVRPLYDLLASLGMRTTKTVWPFRHEGPSNFVNCQTLEDPAYLDFVLDLQSRGFEITWHGASFESSPRERTMRGLQRMKELFGVLPRVHTNHSHNRENIYWGPARFDGFGLGWLYGKTARLAPGHFAGHDPESPFWWGDICKDSVVYARNLTFNRLNLESINPSMPYRDPKRPLVPLWFSASDAESVVEFNRLISPRNQDRLERSGGFTVVATHLGKGFVTNGKVDPTTKKHLEELAGRGGWFPTTGELLDWLAAQRTPVTIPGDEWRRMQLRFTLDLFERRLRRRLSPTAPVPGRSGRR